MSNFPAPKKLSIDAFRYDLPEDRIAIKPLDRRDQSKLLVYRQGQITDSHFDQADTYLESYSRSFAFSEIIRKHNRDHVS